MTIPGPKKTPAKTFPFPASCFFLDAKPGLEKESPSNKIELAE